MIAKLFEVRDSGTFIPVVAVLMFPFGSGLTESEAWLMRRAGYGAVGCVFVGKIETGGGEYDPYCWNNRTMQVSHLYIEEHFTELESGAVVDVQFILKETAQPKLSERMT